MFERGESSLAGLRLYTSWHLNLDYSSINRDQYTKIITKCYWPILEIVSELGIPFGIEIGGSTAETIEKIDPNWIREAARLSDCGLIEIIGSGYKQIVGPLAPHQISVTNFQRGQEVLKRLFGVESRIAYANEQCISSGTLEAIAAVGFEAAIVEWENAWIANPEWPEELGYRPQVADMESKVGIIWNHSRFFQGLQRVAHRELSMDSYLQLFHNLEIESLPRICFYGGDAETFDFRPGRFGSESRLWDSEWRVVSEAISRVTELGATFVLPGDVVRDSQSDPLNMFNAGNQIITKKQAKYNPTRWAVGGRENYELNNYSFSRASSVESLGGSAVGTINDPDLGVWSSDLRTHITDQRWKEFVSNHEDVMAYSSKNQPNISAPASAKRIEDPFQQFTIVSDSFTSLIDLSRGLTIDSLVTNCKCRSKLIGRIPFGSIKGPGHSPDWYTGNILFQEPGCHQETEISSGVESAYWRSNEGSIYSNHRSSSFSLSKRFGTCADTDSLGLEYLFTWNKNPRGITRAGLMTFLPDAWDWGSMVFSASNGGAGRSEFPIGRHLIQHGTPASSLVSASNCVGLTDGGFSIFDGKHKLDVRLESYCLGAVALLDFQPHGNQSLLRISFSLHEIDDTSKARISRATAFGFRIRATCESQ